MNPPQWLYRLFLICTPSSRPDLEGDFLELYDYDLQSNPKWKVNFKWTLYSLGLIRLKILIPNSNKMKRHNYLMFAMHFKIGWRSLIKNKVYSLINLLGLSVGLAVCMLIAIFVRDELSYDKHFKDHETIYRLAGKYSSGGDNKTKSAMSSYLVKPAVNKNFKDIQYITQLDLATEIVSIEQTHFLEENIAKVDSLFFDVFQFKFISGNKSALEDPSSIVLTREVAEKYFGRNEVMGKTVTINEQQFQVKAIIENPPKNTHFQASIFLPLHGVLAWYPDWVTNNSSGYNMYTYIKTYQKVNPISFEDEFNQFIAGITNGYEPPEYFLQPIASIHLESDINHEAAENGNLTAVYVFATVAFIILLLGCINYINLSLASSFKRCKEVGMKKVLGASIGSQVTQFQLESILMAVIAAIFATIITLFLIPPFNLLTEKDFSLQLFSDKFLFLGLFGIALFIGFVTGSFPALFLLKIPVLSGLKGNITLGSRSKFTARNILVGVQFFISVTLIVSTLAIINQINFLRNKDLGIDSEEVILIPLSTNNVSTNYKIFREELLKEPSILNIAASNNKVTNRVGGWRGYQTTEMDEQVTCPTVVITHDFLKTMGAEIIEGRDYGREYSTDATQAYILNESAVSFFGLEDPVGKKLTGSAFTGASWSSKNAKVIGVVKDFHFASLHNNVRPVVFSLHSEITSGLAWAEIKISPKNVRETIAKIEKIWDSFAPEHPFYFEFMDDEINEHYQKEETFLQVLSIFAGLSILIGSLGLFGISAYIMKWRTKEIGVRKILGAKINTLIFLLSKDFLVLILIANVIGWPLAYLLIDDWIQNFAYQAPLPWWIFLSTAFGLFIIAFSTLIYHILKVTKENPVKAIKYE